MNNFRVANLIARKPDNFKAHNLHGKLCQKLERFEAAIASYDKAISIKQDYVESHRNRGALMLRLNRFLESISSFQQAIKLNNSIDYVFDCYVHAKQCICDWSAYDNDCQRMRDIIEESRIVNDPFVLFSLPINIGLHYKNACLHASRYFPTKIEIGKLRKCSGNDRIRIGYFCGNFGCHPSSYLTVELFAKHDRSKFEIFAFALSSRPGGEFLERVKSGFDSFIEVSHLSDKQIVDLARAYKIDVAVDLVGFTSGSRTRVFSRRAAPIQVSFLGFLGTMGAGFIDYIISDKIVIEEEMQAFYVEKVACIPHTCYPTSYHDAIFSTNREFKRGEVGLPDKKFVFCCFNRNVKFTPVTFEQLGMNILKHVEGSVLWLEAGSATAANNLRAEASKRGVDQRRLIFAPHMPVAEHVARYKLADLFLDTLPYNAHTTATDALWAGLPVLTQIGDTFAGRVAASLLTAIGLPELITNSAAEYETLAVELATRAQKLRKIKTKLAANRLTTPLFNTDLFTKKLEAAYEAMYQRYHADLPPDHIFLEP